MIKLSISVMAHPSREKYFGYLKEKLSNPKFSIDVDSKGLLWNCVNSWKMHDLDSDYHVVIQDDAIVCDDFKNRAEKIIEEVIKKHGKIAFNFYYGTRGAMKEEAFAGLKKGYIIKKSPHWGLAICLPTSTIKDMVSFFEKQNVKQDDFRIAKYLNEIGMLVYFPMPSLIDHRPEVLSMVENAPNAGRRAYKFIENK